MFKPKYETLNRIEIDAVKIISNFNYLKSIQAGVEIFPVLKSNAYGHGLKEMCQILNQTSTKMVIVDSYPEAQIVYKYFSKKVLILGEMPLKAYNYAKFKRTEFIVYNESTLKYLSQFGKKAHVHLFINSGMNREGIQDIDQFIKDNKVYLDKVEVSGFCSHLASADDRSALNVNQEDVFISGLTILREAGYFPRWVHLGNSAALSWADNKLLTAFRPGLALYGYSPFSDSEDYYSHLKPALEAYSKVISIQQLTTGASISYGETYRLSKDSQIATIPFGYYEGLDRRLSNKAKLMICGNSCFFARVAGRVCMNLTCLDVGSNNVQLGDEVKVISSDTGDYNSLDNLANIANTINYDILVKLQPNIRRVILNLDKIK